MGTFALPYPSPQSATGGNVAPYNILPPWWSGFGRYQEAPNYHKFGPAVFGTGHGK